MQQGKEGSKRKVLPMGSKEGPWGIGMSRPFRILAPFFETVFSLLVQEDFGIPDTPSG